MQKEEKKPSYSHFQSFFLGLYVTLLLNKVSFVGAYFHLIFMVIIGQFLCGFGAYSMVTLCYTLLADFCSDELRSRAVVIINSVW